VVSGRTYTGEPRTSIFNQSGQGGLPAHSAGAAIVGVGVGDSDAVGESVGVGDAVAGVADGVGDADAQSGPATTPAILPTATGTPVAVL